MTTSPTVWEAPWIVQNTLPSRWGPRATERCAARQDYGPRAPNFALGTSTSFDQAQTPIAQGAKGLVPDAWTG